MKCDNRIPCPQNIYYVRLWPRSLSPAHNTATDSVLEIPPVVEYLSKSADMNFMRCKWKKLQDHKFGYRQKWMLQDSDAVVIGLPEFEVSALGEDATHMYGYVLSVNNLLMIRGVSIPCNRSGLRVAFALV